MAVKPDAQSQEIKHLQNVAYPPKTGTLNPPTLSIVCKKTRPKQNKRLSMHPIWR